MIFCNGFFFSLQVEKRPKNKKKIKSPCLFLFADTFFFVCSEDAPAQSSESATATAVSSSSAPAKSSRPAEPVEEFEEGVTETPFVNGEKTVTEFRLNEQGQRVKIVRTVRLVTQETRVKKSVFDR